MNTIKINACPKCGAPVPPEAPLGLCPRCVMAAVAAPEVAPTATSQIPSLERLAVAFPQLQILELIGRGGMGFVFKARQPHLDRFVALKLLPDSLAHDPQFAERFNREGRVLARLNHPNIVSIFDFGQAGGFYYLMMEYVDGVNLRQAMQAGRFSPAEALTIVPKICEALQFAHEEGILHRDIKPENILLDSKGRIKIADFGIAKLVGEDKPDISLTATGAALGTMHYMAPEQIEKPATVDHRADIYSLGVVFYELLTGELPLGRFGPPSARTPVDPRVDDVVMRTLEREREKRFQSAGEMKTNVEHLTEVGAGAAVQALTPAEDFILCPPRLPRMAKAIIVYALVLAPLFWLLGLFTIEPLPDHALVKFVQGALNVLISGVEFLVLIVLAIGGWKLRGLRPSAPTWLKTGLWLHFSLMLLAIAGQIYVERLASELIRNAPLKRPVLADGIMLAAGLACIVFEISAFVWLRRHTALLKSLCPPAAKSSRPRGTMVIKPGDVVPSVPQWSLKAVWGAVLVGISLLPMIAVVLLVVYLATSRHGGAIGGWEMILILIAILPGITGTILGWMGLSDVRAHAGQRRGLPLAVFAALALPLGLLLLTTFVAPLWFYFVYMPAQNGGALPIISATLMLLVPAGTLTFAIWAVYATARWSANQPAPERRGKLKWIFAGLMACGVGYIALASLQHVQRNRAYDKANEDRLPNPPMAAVDTNTIPWIRFTFTSVELREEKGVRWLAIDYLDDVHGECQKSFPWENTIPGFTATTRATEFLKESKDFSPEVRHQRIEYRMPDSSPRDQLERLRDNLNKALKQKSFRLELGENEVPLLLFELPGVEGGSLQARFKVVPPLRVSPEQPLAFGPVLERFLPEFTAIDLHSGQTKTLPLSLTNRNITAVPAERDIEIFDWLEREGMDFAFLGGHIFQGRMPGMGTLSFEAWDFSPTQLDASVRTIGKVVPFKVEDNPRGNFTYGFKTRGGKLGLLKIIYADNPRGVKFRYKLVQSGKDDADEARIRLAREVLAAAQKNFDAGRLNPFEMAQAEREFAAAESRGDAVAAARLNLKFAEASLRETKRRVEIGVLAPLDLKFAESRHAQAEIDLKAALTANSATAKTVQAEVTPPNENGANARALQFRLVADDADTTTPTDMMMESRGNGTSNSLRVLRTVLLDGSVVDRAAIGLEANGHSTIEVELTTEGARQFAAITAANVNRRLAIVSGGRVLSAPIIRTAISGGKLQISGNIPPAEARQIVATLNRTELVDVSNPTSNARMVIDVFKIEDFPPDAPPPTNRLDWSFKCLIPPEHTAQILFVRWTNDVPNIIEGHSAYYKVGNTPAEVDVLIDHDLNGPPVPPEKRSQWSSNLGLGFTLSTYDAVDPPYRKLSTPSRMSVRSGHQQKIPLVEFNDAGGHANRIELMVFLQPLSTRAIRTVPTEKDQGHFISGKGLAGTRQEALQAIRDLPTDP